MKAAPTNAGDIVIIGAPRSGTNMLRDILAGRDGVVTWPCDEINAVWRHGARNHPTDEIPARLADEQTRRFIARKFDLARRRGHGHTVVEKTCANSLRVGYVAALVPRARFVLITRDGVDASASAMSRWYAPVDWRYTARKARFVPTGDIAHAGLRFAKNQISRRPGELEVGTAWGPRFQGIDELIQSHSLEEVCAAQWRRCVELSHAALCDVPASRVHRLSYEDFVSNPQAELVDLLDFLDLPSNGAASAVEGVSGSSVGKGRLSLNEPQLARVEAVLAPTLGRLGYV